MIQALSSTASKLAETKATNTALDWQLTGISDKLAKTFNLLRNPLSGKITNRDEVEYYRIILGVWDESFGKNGRQLALVNAGNKQYPNYFATQKQCSEGFFLEYAVTKEYFNRTLWWNLMQNNLGLRGRLIFRANNIIDYVDKKEDERSFSPFKARITLSFHILIVLQEISCISDIETLQQRLKKELSFFAGVRSGCNFKQGGHKKYNMHCMLTEIIDFFCFISTESSAFTLENMPLVNDLEVLWQDIYKYLRDAFRNRSYRTGANTKLDQALEAIVPPHVFKKEEAEQNITYSSGNGTVGETKAIDYDGHPCLLVDHSSGPPKKNLDDLVVAHRNEETQSKNSVLGKSSGALKSLYNTCKSAWNSARNYGENLWLGESGLVGNSDAQMISNTIELVGEIPEILNRLRRLSNVHGGVGDIGTNGTILHDRIRIYQDLNQIQSALKSNLEIFDSCMEFIYSEVSRARKADHHFGVGVRDARILNKKMLETITRISQKCKKALLDISQYDYSKACKKVMSDVIYIQSFQGKFSNPFPNTMQTHTTSSTWMPPQSRRQVTYQGQNVQLVPQIELVEDEPYHDPAPSQRHVAMRPFVANDASREHVAHSLDVKSHQQIKPWRGREVFVLVLCAVPVAASVAYAICGEWLFQLYWPLLLAGGLSFLFLALIGCMVIDHRSSRLSAHQPMLDLGNTRNAYVSGERPLEFANWASDSTRLGTVPPSDDILPGGRTSLDTERTLSIDSAPFVESAEHTSLGFPPSGLADSDDSGNTSNSAFFQQRTNVNHRHSGEDNAAEDKADELSKFFLGPDAQSMP